jgi:hypothetical protein
MKKYYAFMLTILMSLSLTETRAQEEMQFLIGGKDNDVAISGFAAALMEFSGFDGDFGFSMGGGAAMLVDQRFFIGGYGLGLTTQHQQNLTKVNPYDYDENITYKGLYTRFGHGGFWLGYIHQPYKPINFGINTKLGWGAVSMTQKTQKDASNRWIYVMNDNVFVITPELDVNLNLLTWMRMSLGLGYRFVTGVNDTYDYWNENDELVQADYFSKNALNSVTGSITFAFGFFK